MLDANTGKPRTIIDMEKAAKLTVREGPLRFEKLSIPDGSLSAEDGMVVPTMPPEANEAA